MNESNKKMRCENKILTSKINIETIEWGEVIESGRNAFKEMSKNIKSYIYLAELGTRWVIAFHLEMSCTFFVPSPDMSHCINQLLIKESEK
jgi:hypothetical protein